MSSDRFGPLSGDLRRQSLVQTEPVFDLSAALKAASLFEAAGWALIAWEGWVASPDGRYGHPKAVLGTESINKGNTESWSDYVRRSWEFGRITMRKEAARWPIRGHTVDERLYFCLTPIAPPGSPFSTTS